jgi:hypothetical protein
MSQVTFGGFFHFKYAGERKINTEEVKEEFDSLKYGLGMGGSSKGVNEYHLDTYQQDVEEAGAKKPFTHVTLSTSESVDRNHNVLHQMLMRIAKELGADAVSDVRGQFVRFAENNDLYKTLSGVFPPVLEKQRESIPEELRAKE